MTHSSFNPVHRHHIEMMVAAKRRLEEEGFHVIKGLMAIASQTALLDKCEWALSDEERLHCIQLSCEDHEEARGWLYGDSRGGDFKSGSSYRVHVQETDLEPLTKVVVFKVIGSDVEDRFPREIVGPTIMVNRKAGEKVDAPSQSSHDLLLRCESVSNDLYSSTQVRNALRDGRDGSLHDRCSQRTATY